MRNLTDHERIGQDLWPHRRRLLVRRALEAKDGQSIHLSDGEAETLARQETDREIAQRLNAYDLMDAKQARPKPTPRPNYAADIDP
jgi:hypothetical protein